MNTLRCLVAATLLAASVATQAQPAAAASAPAGGAALARACKQDVQTLCPGVEAGGGRIAHCLREKQKDISEGCKAALKAQRGNRRAPRE